MINYCDVAVIGAGLSGLTCAKKLQNKGFQVLVLDKSRGVGGRLATRRLHDTTVDHGLPYLYLQGELSQKLIHELQEQNLVHLWQGEMYDLQVDNFLHKSALINRYFVPEGITSVAKYLARDLSIKRQSKVTKISQDNDNNWLLNLENSPEIIKAKYIVSAIPAPQALTLIENSPNLNLPQELIQDLASVIFHPCLVMMAGYDKQNKLPPWQGLRIEHECLKLILFDGSKRYNDHESVFIVHSSPEFADYYLDEDNLDLAAQEMLNIATNLTNFEFNQPNWYQIHRWRYATVKNNLIRGYLRANNLLFCGDWCQGKLLEDALYSGNITADQIN